MLANQMKQYFKLPKPHYAAFILALAVLPALLWLFQRTTEQLSYANGWLNHTYAVMGRISSLQRDLELAESARRAYAMAGEQSYLAPYYVMRQELPQTLRELKALTADNPLQAGKLRALQPLVSGLMTLVEQDIRQPAAKRPQLKVMAQAKAIIDQARVLFGEMENEETRLLQARSDVSEQKMRNLKLLLSLVSATFIGLLLFSFLTLYREILQRRRTERYLIESRALAEATVRHLTLMGEMNDLLHPAQDIKEALQIVASFTERLVTSRGGAIYLYSKPKGRFEPAVNWGAMGAAGDFAVDDCWALRRGELHALNHARHAVACQHVADPDRVSTLCAPIIVQGQKLGIIHLENPAAQPFTDSEQGLLGQIAVALANNRLRASLRNLSVRDPLTGLFNRRYMEESLAREIANAARTGQSLGMLILDLDHFKNVNDSFGHEVGDFVLREIAKLLVQHSRAGDIVCRFGGEEFIVIYLAVQSQVLAQFAEQLRLAIHALRLEHDGRLLGRITASFGLADYPQHGSNGEVLLRAADQALYRAKASGRDCIEMATAEA